MAYNKEQIAAKLLRWEAFLNDFKLPVWDELPAIDLYMDQVILIINRYLDFFAYEGNDEKLLTPAMVNNYVKLGIMPPPVKKKYGRAHIAFLIMICTLKQTLGMSEVKSVLPHGDEENIRRDYDQFTVMHQDLSRYFTRQIKSIGAPIFDETQNTGSEVNDLVVSAAIVASFAKLVTGKIIALRLVEEPEKPKKNRNDPAKEN